MSFLFVGLFLGILANLNYSIEAKWTDIFTLFVASAGVVLGYITFFRWVGNKKKDDSYLSAKDYLSALNEIRELIREIDFQYSHLCPAPGLLVEPLEITNERLERLEQLKHQLYEARVNLHHCKDELSFWNVKLSDSFTDKHDQFVKDITNLNTVMTGFNSQLYHFYNSEEEEGRSQSVQRHKKMFNDYLIPAFDFLDSRIKMGFENVFIFQ